MTYKLIPEAESPEWEEMIDKTFLVVGENWLHADVATLGEDGVWYSPMDGSEHYPKPTHYMEIPKFKADDVRIG